MHASPSPQDRAVFAPHRSACGCPPLALGTHTPAARRGVAAAASAEPRDFDEFLELVADKFEKVDNKPVVIG